MSSKEEEKTTITICCGEELRVAYHDGRAEFMAVCKKCGTQFFLDAERETLTSEDGTFGCMRLGTYIGGSGAVSFNL